MPVAVTCVMPAYNHARYVAEAVRSVLTEELSGVVEVVAVDDASTDRTYDVLRELARELPGLTVMRNERNLGVASTLRRALEAASSPYVTGLASDDRWLPGRLETQLAALESGARWSFGRAHVINARSVRTSAEPQGWPPAPDGMLAMLLRGQAVYAPTLMYHRDLLSQTGGVVDALWEDLAVTLRFAAVAEPHYVANPLVEYRVHDANVHLGIVADRQHFVAHAEAVRLLQGWDGLPEQHRETVEEHAAVWTWLAAYASGELRLGDLRRLPRRPLALVLRRQAADLLRHQPRRETHRLEAALRLVGARDAAAEVAGALGGGPLWTRAARRARAAVRRRRPVRSGPPRP